MAARREGDKWIDSNERAAQIIVNADGTAVSAGGGGGTSSTDDAAFVVGVSSVTPAGGIVTADSVDAGDVGAFAMLANRQQKITLYDSSGAEITSFGGGTEYTEDAASAADPKGGMLISRRRDALTSEVSTDGDNIAVNATAKGEVYVKHVDPIAATQSGAWNVGTVSTVTNVVHVDDNASTLSVDDGGGSLTIDGTVDNLARFSPKKESLWLHIETLIGGLTLTSVRPGSSSTRTAPRSGRPRPVRRWRPARTTSARSARTPPTSPSTRPSPTPRTPPTTSSADGSR